MHDSKSQRKVRSIFPPNLFLCQLLMTSVHLGIIRRSWESIVNVFSLIARYIYLAISTVLFLDSWALRSSSPSGGKKKGFLIGLLILLPLLLLGGKFISNSSSMPWKRVNAFGPSKESFFMPLACFARLSSRFNHFCLLIIAIFLSLTPKSFSTFSGTYYYLEKPVPIPTISLDELIDPQLVDYVKSASIDNYNIVANFTTDYWLYVKAVAHNSAIEAKKLWSENFPY